VDLDRRENSKIKIEKTFIFILKGHLKEKKRMPNTRHRRPDKKISDCPFKSCDVSTFRFLEVN
jgi:hypothetical protein